MANIIVVGGQVILTGKTQPLQQLEASLTGKTAPSSNVARQVQGRLGELIRSGVVKVQRRSDKKRSGQ